MKQSLQKIILCLIVIAFLINNIHAQYNYPVRKDVSFGGKLVDMQKLFTDYINKTGNTYFMQARQLSLEGMKLNDAMENRKAIICYLKAELLLNDSKINSPVKDLLLADILQNKGRTYHYVGKPVARDFCEDSKKINELLIYNPDAEIARFAYFFLATNYDMLEGIYIIHFHISNPQLAYAAVKIKRDILKIHGAEMGRSYWNYSTFFAGSSSKSIKNDSLIYYTHLALEEFKIDKDLDRVYNGEFISSTNTSLANRYMNVYDEVDSCKFYVEKTIACLAIQQHYTLPDTLPAFLDYEEMIRMSRELSVCLSYIYQQTKNKTYGKLAKAILDSAQNRMINYSTETFNQGYRNTGEMIEVNKFMIRTLGVENNFPIENEDAVQFIAEQENEKTFNYKKRLQENEIINLSKNGRGEILNIRELNSEYDKLEEDRLQMNHEEYLERNLAILSKIDSLEQSSYKKQIAKSFNPRLETDEVRNIPHNLDSNTLILFYNYDMVSVCSVISSDGLTVNKLDLDDNAEKCIDTLQYLSASQTNITPEWCKLSNHIYKLLVEPFIKDHNQKELVIIPSGNLSRLAFESLVTSYKTEPNGKVKAGYLVNKYNIRYEYSLEPFYNKEDDNKTKREENIYAFAPNYENEKMNAAQLLAVNTRSNNEPNLRSEATPLKYNVDEVKEIMKDKQGYIFINKDATEEKFREVAGKADILHLAMHGFSRTDDPMYSGLVFAKNKNDNNIQSSVINNDSTFWINDGILHAYEIYEMNLKADLIVLSACETGIGRYDAGEGTRSLGLAFRYAGCNNTVMSLWKVDDENTKKLMKLFYDYLDEGKPKAEALTLAKREFIHENPTAGPFYWSPFVLYGDNEPVHLEQKSNNSLWIVGGIALLIAIAIIAVKKKKEVAT